MKAANVMQMMNKKFMEQMFRPVDNVVWDILSGKMGILTDDECIATLEIIPGDYEDLTDKISEFTAPELAEQFRDETAKNKAAVKDDYSVTLNPMATMSMAMPAYGQKVSGNNVKIGDIIINNKGEAHGWVIEIKKNGTFKIQNVSGTVNTINPPKINLAGMGDTGGIMVVKQLFDITGNNTNSFQSMLMPMMMMNGGELDGDQLNKMIPMMLMMNSGSMGGQNQDGNNMMQSMMMMQMFNKGNF